MSGARPWPTSLVFKRSDGALHIAFDDGFAASIPFERLRVESPSAEVRGHGDAPRRQVTGKANVSVSEAIPVGRYAVRIVFDDGHSTGIYSWDLLREMATAEL